MSFKVVVLASGAGTLLGALLDGCAAGVVDAQVVAVGSDQPGAQALQRAANAGIPTFCLPLAKGADRTAWDAQLTQLVSHYQPDLVVSAGFMKLVGKPFLARFAGRFINTHPALLPSFPGMHAVRDALAAGVKVSGATVFMVDAGVDTGRIIAQCAVDVKDGDDETSLHERIKVVERRLLLEVVNQFAGAKHD